VMPPAAAPEASAAAPAAAEAVKTEAPAEGSDQSAPTTES
jgi:hypothetical protein